MKAQLIESEEEHHWVLLEHRITQLVVDPGALRLQTWSLDGSAEVRFGAPFRLRLTSGSERTLDPHAPESLAPALPLVGRPMRSLTVTRHGELVVELADGLTLEAAPHPRHDAWEVQGGGVLEGMAYRCAAGSRALW